MNENAEIEPAARRPHVVALPLSTKGHVNPMMHFCKLLAARGVAITFVTSEFTASQVAPAEREALQRLGIHLVALPDGLPSHLDHTIHVLALCESVLSAMPLPFEALLARLLRQQPPPSCVLADTRLPFALTAASKFGLPHASFWTESATSFASLLMSATGSYTGPSQGEPHIPGALFLNEKDLNTFIRSYDPSDFMFQFIMGGFKHLEQSRWIFINTFSDLECQTLEALSKEHPHKFFPIGPLLPPSLLMHDKENESSLNYPQTRLVSTLWVEEEDCLTWLGKFKPKSILYVAFGSLTLVSPQQMEELALGLEATGFPFLWVIRPDLIHGESPNFQKGFLERVKDRAYFVPWAPQLKVLSHKAVGAFFTHAGWNSIMEAIATGVPMLGWPYFSDQPMNCKCVEEGWEVGLMLQRGERDNLVQLVPKCEIEAKVQELMCSKKLHQKAHEWSLLAKKAALQGGPSFMNIQNFVESLTSLG